MKPSPFVLLLALSLSGSLAGCPKESESDSGKGEKKDDKEKKKKGNDDDKDDDKGKKGKSKSKGDDESEKKPKKGDDEAKAEAPKKVEGHSIGGVTVPAWSKPSKSGGKCKPPKTDDEKLSALQKGNDGGAGFDDGKGDVEAIVTDMKKSCDSAGNSVSQALNTGGYTRYGKKQYAKADGWFARALVADPTNTFARYNLACNLALEGKSDDSLWNLAQLVPAAKAGDPRALHYLAKAKSDTDLDSVRKDPKFVATMKDGDDAAKAHPCSTEGEVWGGTECVKICNGYGTTGNCTGGKTCAGTSRFGDGLVPYCVDPVKCKPDEEKMFAANDVGVPDPGAKPSCFVQCDGDAKCPKGKTCTGKAAILTMYGGWMALDVCK